MPLSGQLWYITEGSDADTRLVRVNDDGSLSFTLLDNGAAGTGDDKFSSSFTGDIGVDTATGFYFALLSTSNNDHAVLVRGSINSSAAPTNVALFTTSDIVNTIEVDAINRKIYVGVQNGSGNSPTTTGIKVFSYDAAGALTDLGFLTTAASDNRPVAGGLELLDPQDFALDRTIVSGGRLFYSERLNNKSVDLFRLDVDNPNVATSMIAAGTFPTNGSNGYIMDVEVDESNHKVYFTTRSSTPSGGAGYDANDNAVWWIDASASGGVPTKVTFAGMPANVYFGGDMTFDSSTRQIYIESEETVGSDADDVIYVLQLDAAGTTATYIRSITPSPLFTSGSSAIEGMTFADLAALTVTGSGGSAQEQGAQVTLLSGAPTITDSDGGYLTGATVQITGGTFSSNENSTADDHLGYGAGKQISGTIAGTSITLSWNAATETLTLGGLDTIANYQSALAGLVYWATGDNPTNYGANTTRTITWTINDGTPGVPAGSVNTATSTISIAAVNDAPVNSASISATGSENADIAVTGLQISDVDANPASATMTVTLSVTKGILTLRTNVASGLTAGAITGNGTGSVTITGTANAINTTLAAANGLLFHGNTNVSGTDTLTVVTSDGGSTGTGGALTDTDGYTITIIGINDAPVVSGDGTESLAATNEDVSPSGLANTVSSLFASQFSDADGDSIAGVAVIANGSTAGTGQWQYWNGSTWVNIGAASTSAAVELSALTAIRFAPAADFNGAAPTLTVRLVDTSAGGITNGAIVNTTTNGGTTVFSSGTVVLSHTVTDVNDAPVVINGAAVSLTSVAEDSAPGAGQTITSLFSSHFSDAKDTVAGGSSANLFAGVAVTANAATAAQGVYQYFDGSTWQDLPAVSTSNAFYISASTLVRFVPAADYSGTAPSLTVSMIEDSAGAVTTGQTADLTTVGGSTPYSTSMTLNVVVTPTNDAPIASGSATLNAIDEDLTNYVGVTVNSLFSGNFSDPDGDGLGGVAITGDASSTEGVWQYSLNSGASWTTIVSPSLSSAVLLAGTARLRFVPAADFNGPAPALTAHLIDNSGGAIASGTVVDITTNGGQTHYSSAGVDLNTTINPVNDAPVVPATATAVNTTEQTAAILLGSVTVSDVDLDARNGGAGDYAGATFTVQRAVANANDSFAFDTSGASFTVVGGDILVGGLAVATFTSTGGVLTISFTSLGATATTALVNEIIDHITYTNGSDAPPASVSLNYSFNDGGGQGAGGALSGGGSVNVNIASVNDVHTGGASITGTAAEDSVLTAVSTLVDPDGIGALHYQWQRNTGSGFINVGTDASTYTLGDADIGGVVRVIISYTDAGGTAESATSAATASVVASNDAPTGGVSITGTTTEDQVLTANTSTLADSDGLGTLHYDWQRNTGSGFVSIVGADDQATYTLGDADVGATVRVVVSYTDGQGFANSVTSSATASIAGVNDPHTGGVSITGTATEDQVLTAVSTLADADGLGTLHYDWQRDTGSGFVSTGAADQATYTLGDADVGATVRVVVSYTDSQGFSESATSSATAAIANVNDAPTGGVSITGTATENQVLTANTSALVDNDGLGTLHYDWQRFNGSVWVSTGAADQATYTLGDPDVGNLIRVVVSYTDGHGAAEAVNSSATASIAGVNDPHTGGASITGTATEDQVLTAVSTLADVDGLGTLHYDWQRNTGSGFVSTGAADQATYALGDADVGATIRVVISYTDGQGFSESATSSATASIAGVNDAPTGGASISGTATENQVLTADTSTLADTDGLGTLHYNWQRNTGSGFVNTGAADQATYTLGDADVGATVRVVVSYTDGQGFANSVTSSATASIAGVNDPHTGGVSITGTATEDQVLTAVSTLADVDGLGTLHYDWQRNTGSGFVSTGAADQATYALGDADVGATIRVVVSYTDGQGFSESATSGATAAIANVNDPHTGGASITGPANVGQTLTADTSTLADADGLGTLHYDWQRDTGSGFASIGAADQATYTLVGGDLGAMIRVVVSYTDAHGTAESATSAATANVLPANGPHTGTVTITGTVTEDQVLTVVSTLADPGGLGTLHYDWQRDSGSGFVSIGAADQATYTLGDADVGKTIRVVVSYTDGQGVAESETSAATAVVANVNDAPTGAVAITGAAVEDQILTAVSTLADVDGLGTLHYDWQRDTGSGFVSIGAADQATYTLGDADVGTAIRVRVTYTDQHGTAEAVLSTATGAIANVNDAPSAANDANAVTQRLTVAGTVRANDGDIDNALNTLTVTNVAYNATHVDQAVSAGGTVVNGAYGQLTINPDGTYSYLANHEGLVVGQVVTDKFDYTIKDPSGASATAQLTITVTGSGTGDAGANTIISAGAGDTLTGRGGADTLTGGGGADTFVYESVNDSTVAAYDTITDFQHGVDKLQIAPVITGSTIVTLATDGTDQRLYIDQNGDGAAESLILSKGQGLQVTDILTGVAGFGFTIVGSAGADVLRGGSGADRLTGGAGADTFVYGVGDSATAAPDVITDFQSGVDKLNISAADGGRIVLSHVGAETWVYFGSGANESLVKVTGDVEIGDLITSGTEAGVTIYANAGAENLTGGAGRDILVGGTGTSVLVGGDGADILYGGSGTDTFRYDGLSNSTYAGFDLIVGLETGKDKIDISAMDGGKIILARYGGSSFIYSAFDSSGVPQSAIVVQGLDLKTTDLITSGGANQPFIVMGDGSGQHIADVLVAGAGHDILYGLDGNDTLTGGGGADFMVGGAGADTFVFTAVTDSAPYATDLIFDFNSAEGDRIDLRPIDANSATPADDAFTVVNSFSKVAGQLIIQTADSSGYHHISADVNGDGVADFVLALKVTGTLSASDILL